MFKTTCLLVITAALSYGQATSFAVPGPGQNLASPAANTPPEQRCVVQGQVTNGQTGEPLKKATVSLVRHGKTDGSFVPGQQEGYSEVSHADGTFEFDGVEPGEYSLSGERNGYLRTEYGETGTHGGGTTLTLSPSQHLLKLTLPLNPQGVISGKVVDEDGDPVGGAMVMALRQMWMQGSSRYMPTGNANTDEEGNFRIPNLNPGKYYVSVQIMQFRNAQMSAPPGKPDIRSVRTFYPDSMTRAGAAPISVSSGQTVPGIEIRMRSVATHHIRGKLAGDAAGPSEVSSIQVTPEDDDFPFGIGGMNRTKPDHSFDVAGVAPGRYWVSVMQFSGTVRNVAEAKVEVGASDVNDVVLSAVPSGTLRGQITLRDAPSGTASDLKNVRLTLFPAENRHIFFSGQSETKENGSFVIQNVSPGKYKIYVHGLPQGAYLKSIQFGSQDVLDKEIDLSGGASGELQVALRYGVAEVSGALQLPEAPGDTQPKNSNVSIVLIPESGSVEQTQTANTDQNATFSIKNVPPGRYHALALAGLDFMLLQNPDFIKALASSGVELELKENDKQQLPITLTPPSDVQQIMANLGLESE